MGDNARFDAAARGRDDDEYGVDAVDDTTRLLINASAPASPSSMGSPPFTSKYGATLPGPRPRRQLTAAEAEAARAFLLRLVGALTAFGAPATVVERLGEGAARGLSLRMDVAAFPSWFIARTTLNLDDEVSAVADPFDTVTMHTVSAGLDVSRLEQCDALAREAAAGRISAEAGDARLVAIVRERPLYPQWLQQCAYGWCGTSCALLFYTGSFEDALFATLGGMLVGSVCWLGSIYNLGQSLEFVCALMVAALNRAFVTYVWPDRMCFFASSLGALVWLFPGLGILNAILEISGTAPISGTARMFHSLLIMLMIGFGLAIGSRIGNLGNRITTYGCNSDDATHWYTIIPAFLGCSLAYAVLQNTNRRQIPGAMVTQAVGYVVSIFMPAVVGNEGAIVIAAAAVGLTANVLGWALKRPPYTNVVAGVIFLLPGAMGIRGATAIVQDDYVSATAFGTSMLVGTLSITIGLSLAHTASAPLRGGTALRSTFRWFMRPVVKLGTIAAGVAQLRRLPKPMPSPSKSL